MVMVTVQQFTESGTQDNEWLRSALQPPPAFTALPGLGGQAGRFLKEKPWGFSPHSRITEQVRDKVKSSNASLFAKPSPVWAEILRSEIDDLGRLQEGWDGDDAPPILLVNRTLAGEILSKYTNQNTPQPSVSPTYGGGVEIDWHTSWFDLVIEIEQPDPVYFFFRNQQEEVQTSGRVELQDINQLHALIKALSIQS